MSRRSARPNPAWRKRPESRPWTDAEDAIVIDIAKCGVASWAWGTPIEGRTDGEIIERRFELREAGLVGHPKPI